MVIKLSVKFISYLFHFIVSYLFHMNCHFTIFNFLFQDDNSTGRVGPPLQGIQVKLIDWEEGNYRVSDLPNPRGSFEATLD